jgi:hypothetical protein
MKLWAGKRRPSSWNRQNLRPGKMTRIKNNDLTHYFIRQHNELPESYLKSCEKFFAGLKPSSLPVDKRASLKYNKKRKV